MQIDLRNTELCDDALRAQVCIVGGGIAGLVLAQKLAGQGVEVVLLESGGLHPEPEQQRAASAVEMLGEPHAGSSEGRTWALGGSSLTWGGQILPLPEDAPWPVPAGQLQAFQAEAERVLGVNEMPYEARAFFAAAKAPLPALCEQQPWMTPRLSKFIPFTRRNLGQTLGRDLLRHPRVRVLLHAVAVELLARSEDATRMSAVVVRASGTRRLLVQAEHFVIAAGTVETVRLLLASRTRTPAGIGNDRDQVGRNVHDHLTLTAAAFTGPARERLLRDLRPWIFAGPHGSVVHSVKLETGQTFSEDGKVAPMMAHFIIEEPADSGIGAVRGWLGARQLGREPISGLGALLVQLPSAGAAAAQLAWSAWRQHRRHVSPAAAVALRLNAAQPTPSASRIMLSARVDAFGQPFPALRWVIAEAEHASLRRLGLRLREAFAPYSSAPDDIHWVPELFQAGLLRAGAAYPRPGLPLTDARHLMGGAVMGDDPRTSVVDTNLQVHGIANLHIASLATLPDGRAQLPTLTLLALTLRLGERLGRMLRF